MQQSDAPSVPTAFRAGDGLESQSAVTEALGALGGPPKGWEAALQKARAAEFAVFRATSTSLTEDLARLEQHLAEITVRRETASSSSVADLDLGIRNTMALIESTRTLLAAVPDEAERLATRRAREERARRYAVRSTPRNDEEVSALLDLADQVQADAEAAKAEQRVVQDLVGRATDAQHSARRLLVRELAAQIHDAARACKTAVGSKALRHASFPAFAPPEIGRSYSRALYLSGLVQRLAAGEVPDVDAVFESALGDDDWRTLAEVFKAQTGRYPLGGRARRG